MRTLLVVSMIVLGLAIVGPPGCRRMREHVLLSLLRDSERSVDVTPTDPLVFHFPPTPVRVVAVIDYEDAASEHGHVSFAPPDGSDRYAWAAGVCASWSQSCLDATPPVTLAALTYGVLPPGMGQLEPAGYPPLSLVPGRLYGLALFGDQIFVLKVFYRGRMGVHVMEGARFAEAVLRNRRRDIQTFLANR